MKQGFIRKENDHCKLIKWNFEQLRISSSILLAALGTVVESGDEETSWDYSEIWDIPSKSEVEAKLTKTRNTRSTTPTCTPIPDKFVARCTRSRLRLDEFHSRELSGKELKDLQKASEAPKVSNDGFWRKGSRLNYLQEEGVHIAKLVLAVVRHARCRLDEEVLDVIKSEIEIKYR